VFPEGTRSQDGHVQRFRHGAARLCLEHNVAAVPIAILGAYQAMPKGRFWPKAGRPTVTLRYGAPLYPIEGETHQDLSRRMAQAVAQLFDEDRSTWWTGDATEGLGVPIGRTESRQVASLWRHAAVRIGGVDAGASDSVQRNCRPGIEKMVEAEGGAAADHEAVEAQRLGGHVGARPAPFG
jgi:hypothetical protein